MIPDATNWRHNAWIGPIDRPGTSFLLNMVSLFSFTNLTNVVGYSIVPWEQNDTRQLVYFGRSIRPVSCLIPLHLMHLFPQASRCLPSGISKYLSRITCWHSLGRTRNSSTSIIDCCCISRSFLSGCCIILAYNLTTQWKEICTSYLLISPLTQFSTGFRSTRPISWTME